MTVFKTLTSSTEETEKAGVRLAKMLVAGDFVAMRGDLGAGKTAFIRGMASFLCPEARVASPTYTVVNEYKGSIPLFHFDMYRIEDEESLYGTGFFDYPDRKGICAVEWSERITEFIPENSYTVTIEKCAEDANLRNITVERQFI